MNQVNASSTKRRRTPQVLCGCFNPLNQVNASSTWSVADLPWELICFNPLNQVNASSTSLNVQTRISALKVSILWIKSMPLQLGNKGELARRTKSFNPLNQVNASSTIREPGPPQELSVSILWIKSMPLQHGILDVPLSLIKFQSFESSQCLFNLMFDIPVIGYYCFNPLNQVNASSTKLMFFK